MATDINDIYEKLDSKLQKFSDTLNTLNESCVEYSELYEKYCLKYKKDSNLLKKKMKEAVTEVSKDDI